MYPSNRIRVAVCGPIGTKFGTHMQIHLERVLGKIKKIAPCNLGEGFKGSEIEKCGKAAKRLTLSAPNLAHMQIHSGGILRVYVVKIQVGELWLD